MRYRALSSTGDATIFSGNTMFLANSPATVAQAILTSLLLLQGEWFLDTTVGVPYGTQILGYNTKSTYDGAITASILNVEGVQSMGSYSSTLTDRDLVAVAADVQTDFGPVTIATSFGPGAPQPRVISNPDGTFTVGPGGEVITV